MQLTILLTIRDNKMYGYEILKKVRDRFEGLWEPKTGALYPALKKLQDHGLLDSELIDDKEYYFLSKEGGVWLIETIQTMGGFASMGVRYMTVIMEAYNDMGFEGDSLIHNIDDISIEDRLKMLIKIRDGVEFDLRTLNELIERLERGEK